MPVTLLLTLLLVALPLRAEERAVQLTGINLAGAEFGEQNLPGVPGTDYRYPTREEIERFTIDEGMNVIRLPVRWERLQPRAYESLDEAELARLEQAVDSVVASGATIIIDVHNYARYFGEVIGDGVGLDALADLWSRLADVFGRRAGVMFGLMNEPHDMSSDDWVVAASKAVKAIRLRSDRWILVPGNHWTGAHSWDADWTGVKNSEAMLPIDGTNLAFEVHQYLDADAAGNDPDCTLDGVEELSIVTRWAQQHGRRLFLGEFATSAECTDRLSGMLEHMSVNDDVWLGWTYWAAGEWFGETFGLIRPEDRIGQAQLDALRPYLSDKDERD